jgi:MFS family permease
MEWYDFFLAALLATTVWPLIFFPVFDPVVGTAAALSTYFVVWFSRPIGAYIFGHYGDRIGRKTMLIWTLMLMGVS